MLNRAVNERTMLTKFFCANADTREIGDEARKVTYQEALSHLVWKDDRKHWAKQQQGFAIGHMYYVSPTAGERFYLCVLLTATKGTKSFEDLQTVGIGERGTLG